MTTRSDVELAIRPYEAQDQDRVLDLLSRALGGGPAGERPAEFFRWKHLDNPFGRSFMILAEADDRVVGLRAFMRWRFLLRGRAVDAVRAVDTATDPDFQGRGIFTRLTLAALEELGGQAEMVFNTPNDKSLPGYLKMGWSVVGRIPVRVRVRRPVRFARGLRHLRDEPPGGAGPPVDAVPVADALRDVGGASFWGPVVDDGRLATPKDEAFLLWRYAEAPLLDYRAVSIPGRGLAIFRVRPRGRLWEATVAEVLTARGDVGAARKLLSLVARAAGVDHVTCAFPTGSGLERAARRAAYVRSPLGPVLAARRIEPSEVDPTGMRAWALTLGDVEVF